MLPFIQRSQMQVIVHSPSLQRGCSWAAMPTHDLSTKALTLGRIGASGSSVEASTLSSPWIKGM